MKRLIDQRDAIGLKEISYQMLFNNAFYKMRYPGCPRGIHGATCSEWLHMMQKGQTEYAVEGILGMRKLTSNGNPIESEEDEEATKNDVKSKKRKAQLPKTKRVKAKGEALRRKTVAASKTCEDLIYTTKRQVEQGHNYVFSKVVRTMLTQTPVTMDGYSSANPTGTFPEPTFPKVCALLLNFQRTCSPVFFLCGC